jgi:ArsR family transcriptional regulator
MTESGSAANCCDGTIAEPIDDVAAQDLAAAFKALGDPVRLRLLSMIAARGGGEVCVCDLTGAFAQTGATISHHLKVLRTAGLVAGQRRGTWVYYRVLPERLRQLSTLLDLPVVVPAG